MRAIAFNNALCVQLQLRKFAFIAVDLDQETRTLTFVPLEADTYKGHPAHRLVRDGGSDESSGRMVLIPTTVLPRDLPGSSWRYSVQVGRGKFSFKF